MWVKKKKQRTVYLNTCDIVHLDRFANAASVVRGTNLISMVVLALNIKKNNCFKIRPEFSD